MSTPAIDQYDGSAQRTIDIFVVGTGIIPGYHITREAEAALRHSKEILYVDKSFGIKELLGSYCPNLTDLHAAAYREQFGRLDAYRTMAALVVQAALDHPPVSFAVYGHPLVYALPPFMVIAAAELLGLRIKVLPGISALDTLLVDLRIDPCTEGFQMYEATDLLLRRRPIQPDVPCLIWQIGTVESRLYSEASSRPARFESIQKYLLNFYPPSARIVAVYSASLPLVPPTITEFALENLTSHASDLHQGVTVYIPPVKTRPVADTTLLEAMDDASYLGKLTEQSIRRSELHVQSVTNNEPATV